MTTATEAARYILSDALKRIHRTGGPIGYEDFRTDRLRLDGALMFATAMGERAAAELLNKATDRLYGLAPNADARGLYAEMLAALDAKPD